MSEENIQPIEEVPAAPVVETPAVVEVVEAPAVEVVPAPMPEPTPEPLPAVAVEMPKEEKPKAKKQAPAAVSGERVDEVFLNNCVYKNIYARKSLTIHHLQRRLNELGYKDAYADKDGWFGDLTKLAITNFQKDNGLPATGEVDATTFTKVFEGDPNVRVII